MIYCFVLIASFIFIFPFADNYILKNKIENTFTLLNYTLPNYWFDNSSFIDNEPVYKMDIIENSTIEHFSKNLTGYINKYSIGFYYFDYEGNKELFRFTKKVQINFLCNLVFEEFAKSVVYSIEEASYD